MIAANYLILAAGSLGLLSVAAGLVSSRAGVPLLLVFLGIGMLAGRDGPGNIVFGDFRICYAIGSVALAVILFEGGLKTERAALRSAFWPALTLATLGVLITAGVVAVLCLLLVPKSWSYPAWSLAVLIGAILAPTDAAAVSMLLRRARIAVPPRVAAVLEIESGLNDPVSVFLVVFVTEYLLAPDGLTAGQAALLLAREMAGGGALGIVGGGLLLLGLRRLQLGSLRPVLALMGALTLFGLAQSLGTSGFLAIYLAGLIVGMGEEEREGAAGLAHFFESLGWLAQIALFLMLGMLIVPRQLFQLPWSVLAVTATLILLARPAACWACLKPYGFTGRETAFISWLGLRGAVPIYLTTIPLLAGVRDAQFLFAPTFLIVIISLVVQGWTIAPFGRLVGFGEARWARLTGRG